MCSVKYLPSFNQQQAFVWIISWIMALVLGITQSTVALADINRNPRTRLAWELGEIYAKNKYWLYKELLKSFQTKKYSRSKCIHIQTDCRKIRWPGGGGNLYFLSHIISTVICEWPKRGKSSFFTLKLSRKKGLSGRPRVHWENHHTRQKKFIIVSFCVYHGFYNNLTREVASKLVKY